MLEKVFDERNVEQAKRLKDDAVSWAIEAADLARDAAGDFSTKARDVAGDLSARVRDDYVPRATAAVQDASKAITGDGSISERATKASEAAMNALTPKKKRCPLPYPWFFTALLALLAVVAVVAWRRSRPIDDPWAEESWEDIDDEGLIVVSAKEDEEED